MTCSLPMIMVDQAGFHHREDMVAEEGVLNIDLIFGHQHNRSRYRLSSILRTPGHDRELALGLLFSLGIITTLGDIDDIALCERGRLDDEAHHTITVVLHQRIRFSPLDFSCAIPRYSGCGMCSSSSIDTNNMSLPMHDGGFDVSLLFSLAKKLHSEQPIFSLTGGTHAAALFNQQGGLVLCCEDVGRHNALDKLVGFMLSTNQASLQSGILLMSSRASFEIIHKAARAKIPVVATLSAASSLAIEHAHASGITLLGFLRNERCNVYTHPYRLRRSYEP